MDNPVVTVNGLELKYFSNITPTRFDITKGGRNELTGLNRLRLVAKKWKLVVAYDFIPESLYQSIKSVIDPSPLSLTVHFTYGSDDVTFNGYAVYTSTIAPADEIGRLPEKEFMNEAGGRSNFSLELIEN